MRHALAGLVLALMPLAAAAEIVQVESSRDVAATVEALAAAVEAAGAKVVARVDHGAGARSIGTEIGEAQLVIFGNPAVGTPAIEADRLAGLYLPLRVLVYADADGTVWLAYETPEGMLDGLAIDPGAEVLGRMAGALRNLTAAAAGS